MMTADNISSQEDDVRESSSASENGLEEEESQGPSNEKLLGTAFFSFMGFAIAQTIAAVISGSYALMGDCAAMMVDAMTYLVNWHAERKKHTYSELLKRNPTGRLSLEYRKYTYQLELVPPLISVSTLLVLTSLVLEKAIRILILDVQRDESEQVAPNVHLMLVFSCLNLGLDIVNVFCFSRAKHDWLFATHTHEHVVNDVEENVTTSVSLLVVEHDQDDSLGKKDCISEPNDDEEIEGVTKSKINTLTSVESEYYSDGSKCSVVHDNKDVSNHNVCPEGGSDNSCRDVHHENQNGSHLDMHSENGSNCSCQDEQQNKGDGSNLNMCSAFTHVVADTLRSFAIIAAAIIAEVIPGVSPQVADASAAVAVSVLVALSLIPLLKGIKKTYLALQGVNALLKEEGSERGDEERASGEEEEP